MSIRLTVILPFFNETAFLRMAVWSVLSQGIDDCEVIVVNDNPAQFTDLRIRNLGLPAQVRILSHDINRGLSAARNTGLEASSGSVVAFLDADDYYVTNGLARQLAFAESSGADVIHAQTFLARGGSPKVYPLPRDQVLFAQQEAVRGGLARMDQMQFIVSSWSSLYRRDFLDRSGLRFDVAQTRFEDRLFVLQAATAAGHMATLGVPTRVWRRRAGSISTSAADFSAHLLQLQLLEKCLAHMRSAVEKGLPARFLKRELFNTVSRLIWDMDLIEQMTQPALAEYSELAQRIPVMLGQESFHNSFFDDPIIRKVSRIGQPSRRGCITRRTFFALHAALREGDFAAVAQVLPPRYADSEGAEAAARRAAKPKRRAIAAPVPSARLILHLGMHKTGSTYLQGQLRASREALLRHGILVPETGQDGADRPSTRPGAFAGHLGLLTAQTGEIWSALQEEVRASAAHTVIISCENMLQPFDTDRQAKIAELMDHLSIFSPVQPIAFVRRPDRGAEAIWREIVGNGRRSGARTAAEFLVDHGATLTDLPALFSPFEQASGHTLRFADFDAAAGHLWPRFLTLCGLEGIDMPEHKDIPRYGTPPASQIALARLANALIPMEDLRIEVLQALFRLPAAKSGDQPFLSPAERLGLIDDFCNKSSDWAAQRGYAPDPRLWKVALAGEVWQPPDAPDATALEQLITARLLAERPMTRFERSPEARSGGQVIASPEPALTIRVRPRPWLVNLLRRHGPRRT